MLELTLDRLTKRYRNKIALDQVSASFTQGVYGLLGANGAGKTTMLRLICDILDPTEGEILCNGTPIRRLDGEYRRLLGYLPQDFGYYPDFTALRYLMYIAALKALPPQTARDKVEECISLAGLKGEEKQKIRSYSGGMLRRLGIAQALLNDPRILIMDEPTSGLDPRERIRFRNIISSLSRDRIIILSTHIVSDVEYIADEILLLRSGQLIQKGTVTEVTEHVKGRVWECMVPPAEAEELGRRFAIANLKNLGGLVKVRIVSDEKPFPQAAEAEPGLEDLYLYYFDPKDMPNYRETYGPDQDERGGNGNVSDRTL